MAISEYSLVSLSEVENFMGKEGGTSDDDDLIEALINRVSTLFETYMGRNILSREYTEKYNGKGVSVLFPRQGPITEVSSIHDSYDWAWTDANLIDADTYVVTDSDYITLKSSAAPFSNYTNNIKLIYTAGYTTTPLDLVQACITEVSRMFNNRLEVDVLSQSLADGSVTYFAKDLLPQTKLVLNKYKRQSIV